jgi:hypothetical protein
MTNSEFPNYVVLAALEMHECPPDFVTARLELL